MRLNHNSPIPLHQQAETELLKLINSGEYDNGKLLPNEVELSKQFCISRNTLRQAITKLVTEGLLIRKKGIGTRVARKSITGGIKNWRSFTQEMKMLGVEVKNYELHISLKKTNQKIAHFFECEEGEKCVVLERLRGDVQHPFVYFISYFNPSLPITGAEDYQKPLYEMMENDYGIIVSVSKEEISASLAGEELSEKLEISPEDPILIRKRMVYDDKGMPVEYNIGYYRADSFTYRIEATR